MLDHAVCQVEAYWEVLRKQGKQHDVSSRRFLVVGSNELDEIVRTWVRLLSFAEKLLLLWT